MGSRDHARRCGVFLISEGRLTVSMSYPDIKPVTVLTDATIDEALIFAKSLFDGKHVEPGRLFGMWYVFSVDNHRNEH